MHVKQESQYTIFIVMSRANENKELTYSEFVRKHETKYRDLSRKQKHDRYDQYVSSFISNNAVGRNPASKRSSGLSQSKRKRVKKSSPDEYTQMKAGIYNDYLHSICNPFSESAAVRMPTALDGFMPSTCVHHKEILRTTGTTRVSGEAMMVSLCPDMTRFYQVNNFISAGSSDSINIFNNYTPMKQSFAVQNKYSSFRAVSYGIRVRYTGPPLNCSGILGATVLPPGLDHTTAGWDFDSLSVLPYTKIGPCVDGIEVVAFPFAGDQPFRRTSWSPNEISTGSLPTDVFGGGTGATSESNPGDASFEATGDLIAWKLNSLVSTGDQGQMLDVMRNSQMPQILVFGYDLATDAAFEVELCMNFEMQLRSDANRPQTGNLQQTNLDFSKSNTNAITQVANEVVSEVGPVSTLSEPGVSSIANSNDQSKVLDTISKVAGVAAPMVEGLTELVSGSTSMGWLGGAAVSALETALPLLGIL